MSLRPWKTVVLAALVSTPLAALAVESPLIDCPSTYSPGDSIGREGFYVPSFPGTSLKDVTLYIQFPEEGTYTLSLTAKSGGFDGAVIGAANATVTTNGDKTQWVTWTFANPAVAAGTLVAFQHAKVSGPGQDGYIYYGVITNQDSCPVIQTDDFSGKKSTYRRNGIAIRINGNPDSNGVLKTMTIPAAASIHGANGTFFHSDLHLFNRYAQKIQVTARYRCFAGQNCGQPKTFDVNGYAGVSFSDVVNTVFGAPETAGAIELTYRAFINDDVIHATSRVYTPSSPNPTNGAAVNGVPGSQVTGSSVFLGVSNNGGNKQAGFRTNAGAYNPFDQPAKITFTIYKNTGKLEDASTIGIYTDTWQPFEARQVNDIFAAAGVSSAVGTDYILTAYADQPVIPYVTVIDNVTGDSVVQGPKSW